MHRLVIAKKYKKIAFDTMAESIVFVSKDQALIPSQVKLSRISFLDTKT